MAWGCVTVGWADYRAFLEVSFVGRFPFAKAVLTDRRFPVEAQVEGWSPFIPGDSENSSLPTAVLNLALRNRSQQRLQVRLSFSAQNFFGGENAVQTDANRTRMVFTAPGSPNAMTFTVPLPAADTVRAGDARTGTAREGWWITSMHSPAPDGCRRERVTSTFPVSR